MCRWMGWSGQPVIVEELLFKPKHGLVDQSLHSRMGVETTNGDGFGLGWYGQGDGPGVYHSVAPAWGDANLRELASHIESHMFLAHVRATTGTAIQQTNCHPFRWGRWLFVHNGVIAGFEQMRRELMLAVAPELFADIKGSTDSEVIFHLALTFGLEDDPVGAVEQAIGLVEATAAKHGIEHPVQASMGAHRRRAPVGVPLLERAQVAHAVRLRRGGRRARAVPGQRAAPALPRRGPDRRLRAARRPARRLARDPRVDGADRPAGAGRAAPVQPEGPSSSESSPRVRPTSSGTRRAASSVPAT